MGTKLLSTDPNSKIWFTFHVLIIIIALASKSMSVVVRMNIGVIVDESTRIGKEQRIALNIATRNLNQKSNNLKLSLVLKNSSQNAPLQAASAAIELCKDEEVKAIIGMETWQEAALVAEIGRQYKTPIVSLATAGPSTVPLLLQMDTNYTQQILFTAAMVKYYGWRKVIVFYEDDGHAGTSLLLNQLSQALQDSCSEVDYYFALDGYNPKETVRQGLVNVLAKESRVFIVVKCSIPVAAHLFKEANEIGLLGRESVWIITESIAGLLDSVNSSFVSNMNGVVGIKTSYDETGHQFLDFKNNFFVDFRSKYPNEEYSYPSVHALRAYDGIMAIGQAMDKLGTTNGNLLTRILASNFSGLTGKISFNKKGELKTIPGLRAINVVGKSYKDLGVWTTRDQFTGFQGMDWPGDVRDHIPRGWAMPTNVKPLKIGVPGRTSFEKFVKVETTTNLNRTTYSGFCIDVFLEVVKILEQSYALPYEFQAFDGTYDELVDCVYNKTFDAVVGDVTILANRSKKVEFTQPYAKSGLSMIVPYKSKGSQMGWLFGKPFTWQMWMITGVVLLYTTLSVWFLEHKSNPDFGGSWKEQLSASLWFTFSCVFFAQREKIKSNYTRIVVIVFLVMMFVLTQCYTANLTSMLTVPILEPTTTDFDWLRKTNQPIGCDGDSFVLNYLANVLEFKRENIVKVDNQYAYPDMFDNQTILAAFLEVPYERVFLNQYCKDFTAAPLTYRLGGLGFVFQKGSPIAGDASKAILQLSENGVLKSLDDKWFAPSSECSNTDNDTEQLSIQGFWVIYLFSGATSTLCFVLYLIHLYRSYNRTQDGYDGVWNKLVRLTSFYHKGSNRMSASPGRRGPNMTDEWVPATPPIWDYTPTPSDAGERLHGSPSMIELQLTTVDEHGH